MMASWLIDNQKASNGFVAQRVRALTYVAVSLLFGTAYTIYHGDKLICQVLTMDQIRSDV